jgi:hypothetical protein
MPEQEAVDRLPNHLKGIYLEIKNRVTQFGADIETYARNDGTLAFRASKNFAQIDWRQGDSALRFWVRPEGFNIPEDQKAQVHGVTVTRVPDTHGWSLNHVFDVNGGTNLDAVTKVLRQSYDAVRRRGGKRER